MVCLDTRQSVSSIASMLVKGVISWYLRMHEVTASGTSEVGYVALSEAVKEFYF